MAELSNAGATWIDMPVDVGGRLVTSRKPDDLTAFYSDCLYKAMVETFDHIQVSAK
jgi:putative intracellular protease/amidase